MENLPRDEIHVWLMQRPDELIDLMPLTTAAEQQHAKSMGSSKRRSEWLAGRALLRHCLAWYTREDALTLQFEKTESGKPFLALPNAPSFNLSHGQEWLACAVSYSLSIGIDIDSEARRNNVADIAGRYFDSQECTALAQADDQHAYRRHFFSLWTLKEAYIKCLAETIGSVHLCDIPFDVNEMMPRALFDLPEGYWQFHHAVFDRYQHLALACRRTGCDTATVRLWQWDAATQSRREYTEETLC